MREYTRRDGPGFRPQVFLPRTDGGVVMTDKERREVDCWYAVERPGPVEAYELRPLFEDRAVTGRPMRARFVQELPLGVRTIQLSLITVVHVVAKGVPGALDEPVVTRDGIDAMLEVANEIWSQACIKLVPYYSGGLITEFHDLALQGSFGDCLDEAGHNLVDPHDITSPDKTILNLYLVDDAPFACGTPLTGHVILPT